MKKTLVVYHSRSGHTRLVAQALAARLHADLEEIVVDTPREGLAGYALCALEALTHCTPDIRHGLYDPAHYERVLIGTPVWVGSLSSPVRAWVRRHVLAGAQMGFFCTLGGSGAERALAQLKAACGHAPEATLALTERALADDIEPALDRFIAALQGEPLVKRATRKRAAKKTAAKPVVRRARPAAPAGR